MRWIGGVLHEALGLLVDDGRLALAAVLWLLVIWLALPRLGVSPGWSGLVLFAGLAAILIESTLRGARR